MQSLSRISNAIPRRAEATIRSTAVKRASNAGRRQATRGQGNQRRAFHVTPQKWYPPSPAPGPSAGYAALPQRRLISLAGPDAAKFLQGAITRNIYDVPSDSSASEGPPRQQGIYGAFLNAQGRFLNDVFIYPDTIGIGAKDAAEGETFLVEVDAAEAERLAKHIKLYKLRAKFDVKLLDTEEATVWQAWGDTVTPSIENDCLSVMDQRAPGMGARFVAPFKNIPRSISNELPEAHESAYAIRRYLNGVAEGQEELLREAALPQESNLDLMGGIDFRKGCYVGQELTIRTQHRGVVRKRILPVVVYGPHRGEPRWLEYHNDPELTVVPSNLCAEHIPPETEVGRYKKKGRSAGKFLKGIGNVGLALCRLEVMTSVQVPGTEGAGLVGGGFNPDDEFYMKIGREMREPAEVKVKAFVPEWLREGLAAATRNRE
ncbi:putative folate-binding protein [Zalerion maritima]|uniref:Iron-sulfur cluster assembly factor IBA57 homolog, mitochondrial n=1 Tax=Zalerion maritima TaxID=339359 RepID=A0AAD5RGL0_9PEZI|nr:putative folate-binding protein [Zalerion maritima]